MHFLTHEQATRQGARPSSPKLVVMKEHAADRSVTFDRNSSASSPDVSGVTQPFDWLNQSAFWLPDWNFCSGRADHLRFYFWLVDAVRPRLIVNLTTGKPNDYLAFCQAIERLGYGGKCLGLSAIFDDQQSKIGRNPLRDYHDAHYGHISELRLEAQPILESICPTGIDILLLDGRQAAKMSDTYMRACVDRLSPTGLLLLVDQTEQPEFWWSKFSAMDISCVLHGKSRLQVVATAAHNKRLSPLFGAGGNEAAAEAMRVVFLRLGAALRDQASVRESASFAARLEISLVDQAAASDLFREEMVEMEARAKHHASERDELVTQVAVLEPYVEQFRAEVLRLQGHAVQATEEICRLTQLVADRDLELERRLGAFDEEKAHLERRIRQHVSERNRLAEEVAELSDRHEQWKREAVCRHEREVQTNQEAAIEQEKLARTADYLERTLFHLSNELNAIRLSTSWKITAPLRASLKHFPGSARVLRRGLKLFWWTVSFQLFSRLALWREARRHSVPPSAITSDRSSSISHPRPLPDAVVSVATVVHEDSGHPLPAPANNSNRLQDIENRILELSSVVDMERHRIDYALLAAEGLLDEIELYNHARAQPAYKKVFDEVTPLVSVCVATMNRSDLLVERCLQSLIGQTYKNLQIIVVGDHCTDDTGSRIADLRDDRIVFRNLPSRGPYPPPGIDRWRVAGSNAMTACLSMCDGQFITHLDDDDSVPADRIETLVKAAQQNKADFCWHPFLLERQDGTWYVLGDGRFELGQITTGSIFYHSYFKRFPWNVFSYRTKEPADWNRLRKIRMLRPKLHFVDRPLLFHYREGSQRPFVGRDGESFLD